jgi:hypothetical protein
MKADLLLGDRLVGTRSLIRHLESGCTLRSFFGGDSRTFNERLLSSDC